MKVVGIHEDALSIIGISASIKSHGGKFHVHVEYSNRNGYHQDVMLKKAFEDEEDALASAEEFMSYVVDCINRGHVIDINKWGPIKM